jgi:outer membrane protein OmpA-like peptidoglycan-associated protein
VEAEFDKLKQFNTLLAKLLEEGYRIEIVVKGFASPLNSQVYNTNLSKRRVVSIINYYRELDDGFFAQFMNNSNAAPLLSIKQESYGEDKASVKVSDDVLDVKNSVFSPWAAEERRVQIVAFKLEKNK